MSLQNPTLDIQAWLDTGLTQWHSVPHALSPTRPPSSVIVLFSGRLSPWVAPGGPLLTYLPFSATCRNISFPVVSREVWNWVLLTWFGSHGHPIIIANLHLMFSMCQLYSYSIPWWGSRHTTPKHGTLAHWIFEAEKICGNQQRPDGYSDFPSALLSSRALEDTHGSGDSPVSRARSMLIPEDKRTERRLQWTGLAAFSPVDYTFLVPFTRSYFSLAALSSASYYKKHSGLIGSLSLPPGRICVT